MVKMIFTATFVFMLSLSLTSSVASARMSNYEDCIEKATIEREEMLHEASVWRTQELKKGSIDSSKIEKEYAAKVDRAETTFRAKKFGCLKHPYL